MNQLVSTLFAAISSDSVNIQKAEINAAQFENIFSVILAIGGAVAVIFVVLGGIKYSMSQGNASDLEKAKDMIVYALVGLAFVIMAFTIVQFVTANLF